MASQVILQACSHLFTLGEEGDAGRQVSAYLIDQQRVVRATENDRVDPLILCQQTVDMLLDEVIRAGRIELVVFD